MIETFAKVVLVFAALTFIASPLLVGKVRDKWFPVSQGIGFAIEIILVGRILGWW